MKLFKQLVHFSMLSLKPQFVFMKKGASGRHIDRVVRLEVSDGVERVRQTRRHGFHKVDDEEVHLCTRVAWLARAVAPEWLVKPHLALDVQGKLISPGTDKATHECIDNSTRIKPAMRSKGSVLCAVLRRHLCRSCKHWPQCANLPHKRRKVSQTRRPHQRGGITPLDLQRMSCQEHVDRNSRPGQQGPHGKVLGLSDVAMAPRVNPIGLTLTPTP